MKKVSLQAVMVVQVLVALCVPLYYHLMLTYHFNSYVPLFVVILIVLGVKHLKGRAETMDEYARKTLQIADSICFKFAMVIMGILVLPFLLMSGVAPTFIGYLLTFGMFAMILARACIFIWIDRHGME